MERNFWEKCLRKIESWAEALSRAYVRIYYFLILLFIYMPKRKTEFSEGSCYNLVGVGGSATTGCSAERLENLEKYPHRRTLTASPTKTAEKVAYNRHYVQQFPKSPIQDYSINFIDKKYRFQAWGRCANIIYLSL